LDIQARPQDPEYPLLVYVDAAGSVSSKQRLCRNAGPVELWRRLSNGKPDRDIGDPAQAPKGTYRSAASFDIDDGTDSGNKLIRYPPGSTVEFWAVRPKYKTSTGIIGSPVIKCRRLESPHAFVPVPTPPTPPAG